MHDIRTEFLVRVYRTSFLDGELGSSVMGLTEANNLEQTEDIKKLTNTSTYESAAMNPYKCRSF